MEVKPQDSSATSMVDYFFLSRWQCHNLRDQHRDGTLINTLITPCLCISVFTRTLFQTTGLHVTPLFPPPRANAHCYCHVSWKCSVSCHITARRQLALASALLILYFFKGPSVTRRARFSLLPPPSTSAGLQINFKEPCTANKQSPLAAEDAVAQ